MAAILRFALLVVRLDSDKPTKGNEESLVLTRRNPRFIYQQPRLEIQTIGTI